MNDWNFLVREVGRGRGVQERSLEIAEVLISVISLSVLIVSLLVTDHEEIFSYS